MILWMLATLYAAPVDVESCRGDAAVAAVARFEDMINTGDPAVEVGFADCLARLGLLHSAQRHYLEVVRHGVGSEAYRHALGKAFSLAEQIGDLRSVAGYLRGASLQHFPARPGRDALLFVHGRQLAWDGETLLSIGTLDEISPEFTWSQDAKLIAARSLELAGRHREALDTYRSIDQGPRFSEARQLEARLFKRQGQPEAALASLQQVSADAPFAGPAAASRVRLWLMLDNVDRASEDAQLARSLSKQDGRVSAAELAGLEIEVARCNVGKASRGLKRFQKRWGRAQIALDALAVVGDPNGLEVWEAWFGDDPVRWDLPDSLTIQLGEDGLDKGFLWASLAQVTAERATLAQVEDEAFQAIVQPHLQGVLDDGEQRLHALMGAAHQSHLRDVSSDLTGQLALSESLQRSLTKCPGYRDESDGER